MNILKEIEYIISKYGTTGSITEIQNKNQLYEILLWIATATIIYLLISIYKQLKINTEQEKIIKELNERKYTIKIKKKE